MNDEIMELLMAVLYTVRYRHFQAKRKGLSGEELAQSHRKDQLEIREAVLKMMNPDTDPQEDRKERLLH
jgi:hypothetical protein